jgi:TolA-binding protein
MAWKPILDQAQADLRAGNFYRARHNAESLSRRGVPQPARSAALLVAGKAAYEMRLYGPAAEHYREILISHDTAPEVPSAAFELGWAELRQGNRDAARDAWTRFAEAFAGDPRAPLALGLAAETASASGDTATADTLFQGVIARYPSTPSAGMARLSRALVALREGREDDATRELTEVVRSGEPEVIDTRASLIEALGTHSARADLEARRRQTTASTNGSTNGGAGGGQASAPVELFATRLRKARVSDGTPYLAHGFVSVAAASRGWSDVVVDKLTSDLVDDFPSYPAAPVLLSRVAASAAASAQWPTARRVYERLLARYPGTPVGRTARVEFAEALFRTGATAQARAQSLQAVASGEDVAPRALLLLARIDEAGGRRRDALDAYDRLLREYPRFDRSAESLLTHARLLEDAGEKERAREVLGRVAREGSGEVAAEAAYRLARALSADKQHAAALEAYMTAAYAMDGSRWSRPALLGAGQSLAALGDTDKAVAVYRKLLPQDDDVARGRDLETGGEAAFRIAEILHDTRQYAGAVNLYLTAASLTKGSVAERRALMGALRSQVARGDHAAAQDLYKRLVDAQADAELLANARRALGAGVATPERDGEREPPRPRPAR